MLEPFEAAAAAAGEFAFGGGVLRVVRIKLWRGVRLRTGEGVERWGRRER